MNWVADKQKLVRRPSVNGSEADGNTNIMCELEADGNIRTKYHILAFVHIANNRLLVFDLITREAPATTESNSDPRERKKLKVNQ